MPHDQRKLEDPLIDFLVDHLQHQSRDTIFETLDSLPRNVRFVLLRHHDPLNSDLEPLIELRHEEEFLHTLQKALEGRPLARVLFHLARVYDEIWLTIFQNRTRARQGKAHKAEFLTSIIVVELEELAQKLEHDPSRIQNGVNICLKGRLQEQLEAKPRALVVASWHPPASNDFSDIPILPSLSSILPGEDYLHGSPSRKALAGVGTGGGSDVISASLLGHLFRASTGRDMDLLISTRMWRTGSQGGPGSGQIGTKRNISDHGGHAYGPDSKPVPGTYRVTPSTTSDGRDLETIPLEKHKDVWIVLDQGDEADQNQGNHVDKSTNTIPGSEKTTLSEQLQAIILPLMSVGDHSIGTVIAVDTGGDVFASLGGPSTLFSTPDQDERTILALTQGMRLRHVKPDLMEKVGFEDENESRVCLTLAVLCPGLDSPPNMPWSVQHLLRGVRYIPTSAERKLMIHLLTDEYHMDGSDPSRFGKSSLCLLEALRRMDAREDRARQEAVSVQGSAEGDSHGEWVSLPLPEHVIQTRDNPWGSFAWVTDGMAEIIFVDMKRLGDRILSERMQKGHP